MTSRDSQILTKILSEIAVAGQLIEGITMEDFINDERTARAISMTLINIGELVKNLTPELKEAHTDIRNKVEHVFGAVKLLFRCRKTRYRGQVKVNLQLNMVFAPANLFLADTRFGISA